MLEICVVGFGALGTIYGYQLQSSRRANITAVCRSNYEVLKERGIDIQSEKFGNIYIWKPSRVVRTVEEASDRRYDYVVCTTKFLPDVLPTSQLLGRLLDCTSTIVLIQNGIGVESDILRASPAATILSGCAWIDATVINEGRAVKHGTLDRLVLGIHYPEGMSDGPSIPRETSQTRLNLFVEVLCAGGGGGLTTEHIASQRWRKNLWNISYSIVCTLSRASVATLLSDRWSPVTVPVVRGLMEEAITVARAAGIAPPLPDSAITDATDETHCIYAETYPPRPHGPFIPVHFKPSMLVDLEAARPMEVEGIIGSVVKLARQLGITVPRLETAYAGIALLQEQLIQLHKSTGAK